MIAWIESNIVSIVAIVFVLIFVGIAIASLIRDKKNKKGGCTGNCATCGMGCSFLAQQNKK